MQQWEYKRAINPDNDQLTNIGKDGWELVNVVGPMNKVTVYPSDWADQKYRQNTGLDAFKVADGALIFYFKRTLPEPTT